MDSTLLKFFGELPPWIAVVAAIGMGGAYWGMRSTHKKINGYADNMLERLEAIDERCASRRVECDAHLTDVLEMRRKLFMEITDAKFVAVHDLLEAKFNTIIALLKTNCREKD